jgi:hypothetical protein
VATRGNQLLLRFDPPLVHLLDLMSLHSAPSLLDVSSERAQAHVTKDPTPNSNLPGTQQIEELVNGPRKPISDPELLVQLPPEPIAQEEDGAESAPLVTITQRPSQVSSCLYCLHDIMTDSMPEPSRTARTLRTGPHPWITA